MRSFDIVFTVIKCDKMGLPVAMYMLRTLDYGSWCPAATIVIDEMPYYNFKKYALRNINVL